MILSHEFQFFSVAVPRTGTTSVTTAFKQFAPLPATASFSEKCRFHYQKQFRTAADTRKLKGNIQVISGPADQKHMSFKDICDKKLHKNIHYRSFTFVRNPWDRVVSTYHQHLKPVNLHIPYRRRDYEAATESFDAYVDHWIERSTSMKKQLVDHSGKIGVTYIAHQAYMEEHFFEILRLLGLPSSIKLPLTNNSPQRNNNDYREWFTDQLVEKLTPVLQVDLDSFGYTFDKIEPNSSEIIVKQDECA